VAEAQESRPLKGRGIAVGVQTTLRGLQLAAIYTGDTSWNKQPEQFRKEVADKAVWADGNISEKVLPSSSRNEGCAIAEWIMLNLNAGFISGEDEAYEKAENALWNLNPTTPMAERCWNRKRGGAACTTPGSPWSSLPTTR
jgi:hypothetical protein